MTRREEIVELLQDEIADIAAACQGHVQRIPHLDESDDDYSFLEKLLDRWGDKRVPKVSH